jgi:hypothetical protein
MVPVLGDGDVAAEVRKDEECCKEGEEEEEGEEYGPTRRVLVGGMLIGPSDVRRLSSESWRMWVSFGKAPSSELTFVVEFVGPASYSSNVENVQQTQKDLNTTERIALSMGVTLSYRTAVQYAVAASFFHPPHA